MKRLLLTMLLSLGLLHSAQAAEELGFAYQDRIADAASIIAVDQGFFTEFGVTIQRYRFSSGAATAEALYSGAADIGTMGDTAALILLARNPGLTILASHGGGEGRHRLVTRADLQLHSPAELAGLTLAVKKGTSTYGGLLSYLQAHQLPLSSLKLVDMRPSEMAPALAAGSVDIICASEPTPSLAEQQGGHAFDDLAGLGNDYPILLLASSSYASRHPQQIANFLRAMAKAVDFINNNPRQAATIVARKTGLSEELTDRAMQRHVYALKLDTNTLASLKKTGQMLLNAGKIPALPDLIKRSAQEYLAAAHQQSAL
ncbi:ABC transporter substrate-binding protein [Pelobacter seleniigenes]|uniref:ABC transporter substrate-binding protein n=1 Tax=Pelobacter seleniigenes TaxID=407188 RepID=UPI0004A72F1F|nr:ABC transporter substrate-binding protein [Pelobacter seleniigenes]